MTAELERITVPRNPLHYHCAPNEADCHYAPARDIEDFIAYGVMTSYLDPRDIHPTYEVTNANIRDLREGFLRCLKRTADMLPNVGRGEAVDFGSHGTGCTLYPPGQDPDGGPGEYLDLEWVFDMRAGDGAVCLALRWTDENGGADDRAIWVDSRCFNDRCRLSRLVEQAREANLSNP